MKRLAGLVESPGSAGHFSCFGFFLGFWAKSNRGKNQWGTVKGDNVNQQ